MLADTEVIRRFGRDGHALCADLAAVVDALRAVPVDAAQALGPVGAGFAAALADAVAAQCWQAADLAARAAAGAGAAQSCASAYDGAAHRATALIRL